MGENVYEGSDVCDDPCLWVDVLGDLVDKQIQSLAGNNFLLVTFGSLLFYCLRTRAIHLLCLVQRLGQLTYWEW